MKSLRLILSNPRYFAPAFVFASLNIWFGTWAIYIPAVKEKLRIDKAELGFAIFFLSLGVFTVFPVASKIINRLKVGRATWLGVVMSSIFALFPLLVPNYYLLCASLFLFGAANGFLDISMNTLVTEIEKEDRQNFMSAMHGFFSLGGVIVGLGSLLAPIINNPALHMALTVLLVLVVNLAFRKRYRHIVAAAIEKEPFSLKLFKPLFVLGIISFVSMGSEGAIVDWSGLYLKEVTLAPEALIGAGFLAFSAAMTLGRFLGDGISQRIGSIKIVALGALIAIVGYVMVLSGNTILAITGFALNGLGFSVMVPELFRIRGNVKGVESSQGVAFIAGSGYSGFLIGPVILGFLAEEFTLKTSFWALLGCAAMIFVAIFAMSRKR
ncbi:MFS transporter [Flagellimonas lutaonensis]|uniref:MFS transporter permease n=1 Tax=Flagellimonas lutaonensis TaxID=516051 RepID=A0A0D5YV34_9FLAO|nr:MFS transporter [Allomuricauda lutaonensis]AKA35759.1 MFS transporter permease [Allomuricauda lutaonensis]